MTKSINKSVEQAPVSDFSQSLTEISQLVNNKMPAINVMEANNIDRCVESSVIRFVRELSNKFEVDFFFDDDIEEDFKELIYIIRSLSTNLIAHKLKMENKRNEISQP